MRLSLLSVILGLGFIMHLTGCATHPANNKVALQQQESASYNVQLGLGYLQQGEFERAKTKLNKALKQAPDMPSVHAALGYFHEKTSDFALADVEYRKALSLNPHAGEALNNYGAFLCGRGQNEKAIDYFMRAIQDPNYTTTAQAYENAGLCALKMQDKSIAKGYFEKALQQDPGRASALLELSDYYFDHANYTVAKNYMDRYKRDSAPSARSLWLDIRIAHQLKEDNTVASNALFLKNLFPKSPEYSAMQAMGIQ